LMMSLWDALRMNMMISYQELVRTFPSSVQLVTSKQSIAKSYIYFLFKFI
ncbi:exonuclease, partial [Klebsiella pneumoniae subsp. pneumoniae]